MSNFADLLAGAPARPAGSPAGARRPGPAVPKVLPAPATRSAVRKGRNPAFR